MKSEEIFEVLPTDKLEEYQVGLIYHFGSTAAGYELKFSDIDLGIVFIDRKRLENSLEAYSKLYRLFGEVVKSPYELDIVLLQQTSFLCQYQVISEGRLIYEMTPDFRMEYEEYVIKRYLDFKPVIDYFNECLMKRMRG